MRRLLFAVVGLLALGGLAIQLQPSEAAPMPRNGHWPHTSAPLRLGFAVVGVDEQRVANALAAWNRFPGFDLGTIGPGDPAICDQAVAGETPGIVTVCGDVGERGIVAINADFTIPDHDHFTGARIFVDPGVLEYRLCHEIGHVLGINHPADPNGCIEQTALCPGQGDLDELAVIYGHDDGYTVPDHVYAKTGNLLCTTSPVPTPTPVPSATPTKVPFCVLHPTNRKCK
jgi:hypothetical protein